MTLKDLPEDKMAVIKNVSEDLNGRRLLEIGFHKNQKVKVIGKAPFGDPLAVRIGNSTVMLRSHEAGSVLVEMDS